MTTLHVIATRLLLACCVVATPVALAATPTIPAPVPLQSVHALTAADAETWLDGLVPMALDTAQTPGAVVVIVRDGQILLEKGYGYADWKKRTPVDPKATLFRPGSTSKLFIWTAVMQLVEAGKLKLDADVNTYLDFAIPARDGKPITLRHLMTHTAGFEETAKDLITFNEAVPSLASVLKRHVPKRFFDAGSTSAYSNYGASLAAYIVERVSGQLFDDYIEQHVFKPLAMNSSSFRQPPPPALLARMATGYENSSKQGLGYELISMPPAGSLASSGDDMAHFMIAHLQDGKYGDAQILQSATAQLMHNSVTRQFPDLNGIALGFYEQNINGRRVLAHAGDLNYFHTDLALFLDEHVGIFISVNALGKDGLGEMMRVGLFKAFADRYFPADEPVPAFDPATAKAHAKLIAGSYVGSRGADSTFLSVVNLLSPKVVTANDDGTISVKTMLEPQTYAEVAPFLWREVNGHDRLQAIVRDGKVVRWSTNNLAFGFSFQPAGGALARAGLEMPMVYVGGVVLLLAALAWPGAALVRRHYARPLVYVGQRKLAYHLLGLFAVLALAATGVWVAFFATVMDSSSSHLDGLLRSAQLAALVAFVGGLLVAAWNLLLAIRAKQSAAGMLWIAAQVLAYAALVWICMNYNLIGFGSEY
jgi:CubicO group peptidase (beta-lactamase class C family)